MGRYTKRNTLNPISKKIKMIENHLDTILPEIVESSVS